MQDVEDRVDGFDDAFDNEGNFQYDPVLEEKMRTEEIEGELRAFRGEPLRAAQSGGDPWAHRSEGMMCKTCMWFVQKRPNLAAQIVGHPAIGRCRRHAPSMNGYPVVFMTDWCGDHKLDENKA